MKFFHKNKIVLAIPTAQQEMLCKALQHRIEAQMSLSLFKETTFLPGRVHRQVLKSFIFQSWIGLCGQSMPGLRATWPGSWVCHSLPLPLPGAVTKLQTHCCAMWTTHTLTSLLTCVGVRTANLISKAMLSSLCKVIHTKKIK